MPDHRPRLWANRSAIPVATEDRYGARLQPLRPIRRLRWSADCCYRPGRWYCCSYRGTIGSALSMVSAKQNVFFFFFIPKLKKYSFYRISLLGSNFLNVELVNKMFFFTKLKIFFCIFFNIFFFKGLWNVKSFRRLSQRFYFVRDLDTRLAFTRHWTSL